MLCRCKRHLTDSGHTIVALQDAEGIRRASVRIASIAIRTSGFDENRYIGETITNHHVNYRLFVATYLLDVR